LVFRTSNRKQREEEGVNKERRRWGINRKYDVK